MQRSCRIEARLVESPDQWAIGAYLDHTLEEFPVHLLTLTLLLDQTEDPRAHLLLHGIEDDLFELLHTDCLEWKSAHALDVEAVLARTRISGVRGPN